MSARTKPHQVCGRDLEEVREKDPYGRIVVRHRTIDGLTRLLRSGAITEAMHDAGRAFQRDFQFAGLDPIRARPLMLPVGKGAPDLNESRLDAKRRVHRALEGLGGIGSPGGSCLWHVLGCGCSIREWAITRSWAGRPIRQEQAQGILVAALGVLACSGGHVSTDRLGRGRG